MALGRVQCHVGVLFLYSTSSVHGMSSKALEEVKCNTGAQLQDMQHHCCRHAHHKLCRTCSCRTCSITVADTLITSSAGHAAAGHAASLLQTRSSQAGTEGTSRHCTAHHKQALHKQAHQKQALHRSSMHARPQLHLGAQVRQSKTRTFQSH